MIILRSHLISAKINIFFILHLPWKQLSEQAMVGKHRKGLDTVVDNNRDYYDANLSILKIIGFFNLLLQDSLYICVVNVFV